MDLIRQLRSNNYPLIVINKSMNDKKEKNALYKYLENFGYSSIEDDNFIKFSKDVKNCQEPIINEKN